MWAVFPFPLYRYYYEDGVNKPFLVDDFSGFPAYNVLLTDDRGTVMGVTDTSGALLEKLYYNTSGLCRSYDATVTPNLPNLRYGTSYNIGRSLRQPFGYLGMYRDRFTGLYHTHFRDYDPVHSRWLSEDPAGYADGLNLNAAYMDVNGVDPLGLAGWTGQMMMDFDGRNGTLSDIPKSGNWVIDSFELGMSLARANGVTDEDELMLAGWIYAGERLPDDCDKFMAYATIKDWVATMQGHGSLAQAMCMGHVAATMTNYPEAGYMATSRPLPKSNLQCKPVSQPINASNKSLKSPKSSGTISEVEVRIRANCNKNREVLDASKFGQQQSAAKPATSVIEGKPDVRILNPVKDPSPPIYKRGHPGKPVTDHIRARAAGGHPTDPANLDIKPWEWNARKGAYEGQLLMDRNRLISEGLTPDEADAVLADEWYWLMNDVMARPMDPRILNTIPAPGSIQK